MKHLFIVCVALIAAVKAGDVLDLTDANFKTELAKHDTLLVEFFAPWCGHCKKLAPEYEIAATKLLKDEIRIAKVDCTENQATCGAYSVSGYPTLKVFRGSEDPPSDYSGPRSSDGIVAFMKKQAGPASKELKSVEEWEAYLAKKEEIVLIAYYESGSDDLKQFEKAASTLREDYKFAHTSSEEVMTAAESKNVVKLHRPKVLATKQEDQIVTMDSTPSTTNCRNFLSENAFGRCDVVTSDNLGKFRKPLVIVFHEKLDLVKNPKGTNYWRNRVMKWGGDFKGYFAVANRNTMASFIPDSDTVPKNTDPKDPKPIVIVLNANNQKFIMPELFSKDAFQSFLTKYMKGEIEPFIKSEAVPENNDGPVRVVVGKNFDEIVNDESKDVLIEFYAPWCGHCKSLEPKFNELGEKMKANDDIVIAKMDATANDVPKPFEVQGFPTLYYAPKNGKDEPEKYQGGREVADFVKFLKSKATDKSKFKSEL